ncbi:hypothetical protein D3C80_1907200 [compost metagenome]
MVYCPLRRLRLSDVTETQGAAGAWLTPNAAGSHFGSRPDPSVNNNMWPGKSFTIAKLRSDDVIVSVARVTRLKNYFPAETHLDSASLSVIYMSEI